MNRPPNYLIIAVPMLIAAFLLGVVLGRGEKNLADGRSMSSCDAASSLWTPAPLDPAPQFRKLDYTRPFAPPTMDAILATQEFSGPAKLDGVVHFYLTWNDSTNWFSYDPSYGFSIGWPWEGEFVSGYHHFARSVPVIEP